MSLAGIRASVENNAQWCDAVCTAHGTPGEWSVKDSFRRLDLSDSSRFSMRNGESCTGDQSGVGG